MHATCPPKRRWPFQPVPRFVAVLALIVAAPALKEENVSRAALTNSASAVTFCAVVRVEERSVHGKTSLLSSELVARQSFSIVR